MNLIGDHLSKNYDLDLQNLVNQFLKMGGMAEENLIGALQSLNETNGDLAETVIENDKNINLAEQELDEMVVKVLVKRQPAAIDLRLIMAISKSSADIERMGDESKKIAKMARRAHRFGEAPLGYHEVQQMGKFVLNMVKTALEGFAKFDAEQAHSVIRLDEEIDGMYKSASRAMMTYIMEDGRYVAKVIDILWVLRALERIAAHARNVAEQLIFCITGEDIRYQKSVAAKERLAQESTDSLDELTLNDAPQP